MLNENLIATLEQSLRQTRNAQNRLLGRLSEVETEAQALRQEIEALENSASQTGEAIYSLLATMGASNKNWALKKQAQQFENDDYNLEAEHKRTPPRLNSNGANLNNQNPNNQNNQNNQANQNFHNNQNFQNNQPQHQHQQQPPQNNYRKNRVAYINNSRGGGNNNNNNNGVGNGSSMNPNFEPVSHRFTDRTITQACTLLLREASSPLHVNELYNLLVNGGFEFKGNNPTISIAVSLNRNRRFRKVAPGTFELLMRDASQAAS